MSKLFAGLLMGVTIATGMVAVPQTNAATTATSSSASGPATFDTVPLVIKPGNTRGIDVALDPALYQAHRQISQARRGCHDSGGTDYRIRQRNRSSHVAMY